MTAIGDFEACQRVSPEGHRWPVADNRWQCDLSLQSRLKVMNKKQLILAAIAKTRVSRSESQKNQAVRDLMAIAPAARLSDLLYHGERDRTDEEIAEEAILREGIWENEGEEALAGHIQRQMLEALANPQLPETHYTKISASILLKGMRSR